MNKFMVLIILLAGLLSDAFSSDMSTIEHSLRQAFEATAQSSFRSEFMGETQGGEKTYSIYFQLAAPDGFVYKRLDFTLPGAKDHTAPEAVDQTNRLNRDGAFLCTDNVAVKSSHSDFFWPPRSFWDNLPSGMEVRFSSKPAIYRDVSCLEFTVTVRDYRAESDKSQSHWRGVMKYLVGKQNNFIYAWQEYDTSGKLVDSNEFGNVDFNAVLSPDLFSIAEFTKHYKPKTEDDIAKILYSASSEKMKPRKSIHIPWERFWKNSTLLSIIFAIVGVAAISIVIGMKIWRKRF